MSDDPEIIDPDEIETPSENGKKVAVILGALCVVVLVGAMLRITTQGSQASTGDAASVTPASTDNREVGDFSETFTDRYQKQRDEEAARRREEEERLRKLAAENIGIVPSADTPAGIQQLQQRKLTEAEKWAQKQELEALRLLQNPMEVVGNADPNEIPNAPVSPVNTGVVVTPQTFTDPSQINETLERYRQQLREIESQ